MTPGPNIAPLQVFRVETFIDDRGRAVVSKTKVVMGTHHMTFANLEAPTFIGQGVAAVRTPQGIQQVPFEIPLVGPSVHEAFAQFDGAQEAAFRGHMEKLRLEALKHGADLSQLPKAERN